jgi:tetratricopeptide (TPR) repeat protein
MSAAHRTGSILMSTVVFPAVAAICLLAGCAGLKPPGPSPDEGPEHFSRLLSFETRRQQSSIARSRSFYRDAVLEAYLGDVLSRLIPAQVPDNVSPRVVIVDDEDANAYSFPDGAIYIHTGMLACLENEAELALLLSHELAHALCRHALRAMMALGTPDDAAGTASAPAPSAKAGGDLTAWFGNTEPAETIGCLHREMEAEADRVGLDMLIKADYDASEAIEIFDHLSFVSRGREEALLRAEMLRELAGRQAPKGFRPAEAESFSSRLKALLLRQAVMELRIGRYDRALAFAGRTAGTSPGDARAQFLLGEIFRQRHQPGDQQLALEHYHLSIVSDPSTPEPYKAIGLIHLKQGQAWMAKTFFETALELAPDAPDSSYTRGYVTQCTTQIEGEKR